MSGYVILRSTCPDKGTTRLPREVAGFLGIDLDRLDALAAPYRMVAFAGRRAGGDPAVRVLSAHSAPKLVARELAQGRVVSTTRIARGGTLHLSVRLGEFLRLSPRREGRRWSTDDPVVWIIPVTDYYERRRAGGGFRAARVYLTRAAFSDSALSLEGLASSETLPLPQVGSLDAFMEERQ